MAGKYSPVVKRVATAITQTKRKDLESHFWCVYTEDKMTQDAVLDYVASISRGDDARKQIMYNGKEIPVISLPFHAVMFLKTSKNWTNYKFTFYHKASKGVPWAVWKEDKKTPPEHLRQMNHLFKKKPDDKKPSQEKLPF